MKTNAHFPSRTISEIPISSINVKFNRVLKKRMRSSTFNRISPIDLPEDISTWGEFPVILKPNLNDFKEPTEEAEFGESNY